MESWTDEQSSYIVVQNILILTDSVCISFEASSKIDIMQGCRGKEWRICHRLTCESHW